MPKQIETTVTALFCQKTKEVGKWAIGHGGYFHHDKTDTRYFTQRLTINGKRRDMGLGSLKTISLAEARDQARIYQAIARADGNPFEYRRQEQLDQNLINGGPPFHEIARVVYDARKNSYSNVKFRVQWWTQLKTYSSPIWDKPIDEIMSADILMLLTPIWLTKEETARRISQRLRAIFDWAKAAQLYNGENPVTLAMIGLPKQQRRVAHHKALASAEMPAFIMKLRSEGGKEVACQAFEFLILTVTRTSETLLAEWNEIDFDAKMWVVPPGRMKTRKEHRIPLSSRAIEILERMRKLNVSDKYIFPSMDRSKPLSNMVFLQALKRMEVDVTAHGFRSTFRDWCGEETNYPHAVCERALAHVIKNKSEAAYARSDLFERRIPLMQDWANFITKPAVSADIIPIKRKQT